MTARRPAAVAAAGPPTPPTPLWLVCALRDSRCVYCCGDSETSRWDYPE